MVAGAYFSSTLTATTPLPYYEFHQDHVCVYISLGCASYRDPGTNTPVLAQPGYHQDAIGTVNQGNSHTSR